jgi:hypothetical protein
VELLVVIAIIGILASIADVLDQQDARQVSGVSVPYGLQEHRVGDGVLLHEDGELPHQVPAEQSEAEERSSSRSRADYTFNVTGGQ